MDRKLVKYITAGRSFSVILTVSGSLYSIGLNNLGQLGDGTTSNAVNPVLTEFSQMNLTAVGVTAGYSFVVVITNEGTLYTWGNNEQGQLGTGNIIDPIITIPTMITALNSSKVAVTSCGNAHCLALTQMGHVYSWGGSNTVGQLGDGTTLPKPLLIQVLSVFGIKKAISIFAGFYHSMAITVDGVINGWGR